jgi:predicted RNA-binding Zn-ribbon protein involved in translation (DUF1610 family)
MGGIGSGRRKGRILCEDCWQFDIAELKTDRCDPVPFFRFSAFGDMLFQLWRNKNSVLFYCFVFCDKDLRSFQQSISLTQTSCHFGGKRQWFFCPFCGDRCAKLYSVGNLFSCRKCLNICYYTQSLDKTDRKLVKAIRMRKRLSVRPEFRGFLMKKNGMHRKTFKKISTTIQILEYNYIMERFGQFA